MSTFNNAAGIASPNEANLFPILPSTIKESNFPDIVLHGHFSRTIVPPNLEAGSASVTSYQSRGWTTYTRRDGKYYAHTKASAGITIVTEAQVVKPGVSDQLDAWLVIIYDMVTKKHIHLPESSHLFLEIDQDLCTCNYYFVDHVLRTVFWLHTLDILGIGCPRSSHVYLRHTLEKNYWIHVGLFSEAASEYAVQALNEIYTILQLGRTGAVALDALPFTDEGCGNLIETLEYAKLKGSTSSPAAAPYIVKLWTIIAGHYSSNHFDSKRSLILTVVSTVLLFGLPDYHQAQLESLCADQIIDTPRWSVHVFKTAWGLGMRLVLSWGLFFMNVLMSQFSSSTTLTELSLIICGLHMVVTSILFQEHWTPVGNNSPTSALYLVDRFTRYGFQPIAIIHSLPQALFVWSSTLNNISLYRMASAYTMTPTSKFLSVALLVVTFVNVASAVGRGLSYTCSRHLRGRYSPPAYTEANS